MSAVKNIGVLFLEKARISFFSGNHTSPFVANLPSDIIRNMEVISQEKLSFLIKSLFSQLKIPCTSVLIILSQDYTYDKEFPNDPLEKFTENLNNYQELIPFENISRKTLKINKLWKASFANKDLCEDVKTSIEKLSIIVIGVVPMSMIAVSISEFSKGFSYKLITEKIDLIKHYSFLREVQKEISPQNNNSLIKNNATGIILAVVLFLIAILLVVFYLNMN